ncbi:MAG: hypothetical protein E6I52_13370 [Chloroflexi bacterium]|nr:MAG: hypothetical protein E6I52_13370 [Chloroflexota bacterium]
MADKLVVSEDEAYDLLAHLISSAEICTFEPYHYGTFRLLDAASRLMESMLRHESNGNREWLQAFKKEVDEKKVWMMWDRDGYFRFLREAGGKVGQALKERQARSMATAHSRNDR